jgi:hypothetical protein
MSKIQYLSEETKNNIYHGLERLSKTPVKTSDLCSWIDCIEPQLVAEWYNKTKQDAKVLFSNI